MLGFVLNWPSVMLHYLWLIARGSPPFKKVQSPFAVGSFILFFGLTDWIRVLLVDFEVESSIAKTSSTFIFSSSIIMAIISTAIWVFILKGSIQVMQRIGMLPDHELTSTLFPLSLGIYSIQNIVIIATTALSISNLRPISTVIAILLFWSLFRELHRQIESTP